MELPFVSIVVIGLNEEANLEDTFRAILDMDYPSNKTEVIYVDTGSRDRSVQIARKYTSKVFVERGIWPTSGLARNRGIIEASYGIIHFIDGDISISEDYLKCAIIRMQTGKADAVTGFFREKHPARFFNRLMNIRRDEIIHEERYCDSTNGGGTYFRQKLLSVNGYDERILKGQESELGTRFRAAGNKILFIDKVQGLHNFDLNSVGDFIRVKYNYGRSSGYILKIKKDITDYIEQNNLHTRKTIVSSLISVMVIFASFFADLLFIVPSYYLLRITFLVANGKILKKKSNRQIGYTVIQYIFSFATFFGILAVFLDPRLKPGGKHGLSELKSVETTYD